MICYRCGNPLGSGHLCLRCGADVTVYRKIIGMSNSCYNAGLEKARVRDLTGAVSALRKSVQLNKYNTDARNLLGLVYFEMGEVTEALCQWVVSKNLQSENNLADRYIEKVRKDRNSLEEMNQAIKKYNQALYQAKNEGVDLAIITLKRVLKQQPKLIKAYQLLALCYIQNEEYSNANRILKRALEIDHGNTLCLRYSRQIRGKMGNSRKSRREAREAEERRSELQQARAAEDALALDDDIVVPRRREKVSVSGLSRILVFLAGMAVALCLYQFVILPTVDHNAATAANQKIAFYDNQMSDQTQELASLKEQVESLTAENEDLSGKLDAYTGSDGMFTQYDTLMDIVVSYNDGADDEELEELSDRFLKLDADAVDSETYQTVYQTMYKKLVTERLQSTFNTGMNYFNEDYYTYAIEYFEKCLEMDENYDQALFYLGRCYEHRDDQETANTYFTRLVQNCPNSDYYEAAVDRVGEVAAESESSEEDASAESVSGDEDGAEGLSPGDIE